jgi:hypothetical protein
MGSRHWKLSHFGMADRKGIWANGDTGKETMIAQPIGESGFFSSFHFQTLLFLPPLPLSPIFERRIE